MRRIIFLAFLFFLAIPIHANEIRVLIDYIAADEMDLDLPDSGIFTVTYTKDKSKKLQSTGTVTLSDGLVFSADEDHHLEWRGKPYRGHLEVRKSEDGRFALINVLPLHEYLYGVLPSEVNTKTWPMAALKAQAIVSRSYAYYKLITLPDAVFHVGNTAKHQVYFGATHEDRRAINAVNETRGKILVNKAGDVLQVFFHSCCGGRTEDARFVWSADAPRELVGVNDPYCKINKNFSWVTRLPESSMKKALSTLGYKTNGTVRSILVGNFTRSMRALSLRVITGGERHEIKTSDLRRVLGANWIRSTKIRGIKKKNGQFLIYGRGWGHGVGLCQWGARGMAEKRRSYKRIIKHFFPKARMHTLES